MSEIDVLNALGEMSTAVLMFFAWRSQMLADQQHIERLLAIVERMAANEARPTVIDIVDEKEKPPITGRSILTTALLSGLLLARVLSAYA